MQRRFASELTTAALAAAGVLSPAAQAQETIKVGVLHSLSGTMAISETVLKDTVLMMIDDHNAKGGVLGKKLEQVAGDPASNWPLFAEKARQMITQDKVAVIFGCWTSVSRKRVLPVFEELNSLLFYPVQYEGEELSQERVLHRRGAQPAGHPGRRVPDEQGTAARAKRWVLLGTDYVYPRTTNKILRAFLKSKGVAEADIIEEYTPFGHARLPDHHRRDQEVRRPRARRPRWSPPSTATPTCPSTRSSAMPGPEGDRRAGGGLLGG